MYGYLFKLILAFLTRGKSISTVYSKDKPLAACAEVPMDSKTDFSQWKTYLSELNNKFLKFEEKFAMWPALCKFPILFSTVELKQLQLFLIHL